MAGSDWWDLSVQAHLYPSHSVLAGTVLYLTPIFLILLIIYPRASQPWLHEDHLECFYINAGAWASPWQSNQNPWGGDQDAAIFKAPWVTTLPPG